MEQVCIISEAHLVPQKKWISIIQLSLARNKATGWDEAACDSCQGMKTDMFITSP